MPRPKHNRRCRICNERLERHEKAFCSRECANKDKLVKYINRWKLGLEDGMSGSQGTSKHIHRYLREEHGDKCFKCGWNKVNKKSGKVPIQLNHIDGDYKNNKEENLELLCSNCHSLTETFMGLNKGHGRTDRYKKR